MQSRTGREALEEEPLGSIGRYAEGQQLGLEHMGGNGVVVNVERQNIEVSQKREGRRADIVSQTRRVHE